MVVSVVRGSAQGGSFSPSRLARSGQPPSAGAGSCSRPRRNASSRPSSGRHPRSPHSPRPVGARRAPAGTMTLVPASPASCRASRTGRGSGSERRPADKDCLVATEVRLAKAGIVHFLGVPVGIADAASLGALGEQEAVHARESKKQDSGLGPQVQERTMRRRASARTHRTDGPTRFREGRVAWSSDRAAPAGCRTKSILVGVPPGIQRCRPASRSRLPGRRIHAGGATARSPHRGCRPDPGHRREWLRPWNDAPFASGPRLMCGVFHGRRKQRCRNEGLRQCLQLLPGRPVKRPSPSPQRRTSCRLLWSSDWSADVPLRRDAEPVARTSLSRESRCEPFCFELG